MEDARAAMDLALLKFERGPGYGVAAGERGDPLTEVLGQQARRRSVLVDRQEVLSRHVAGNCSAVVVAAAPGAAGDTAAVEQLARELGKAQVRVRGCGGRGRG